MKNSPMWVVTSFYNPAGYTRRTQNYHAFYRHLNVPLLVIELAKPGHHQLASDDADVVISLSGDDQIWQKERLLNIAISALPEEAEFVAWVDCDVLFGNPDWATTAQSMLTAGNRLVQLFETATHLPSQTLPELVSPAACRNTQPLLCEHSFASVLASGIYFSAGSRLKRTDANDGVASSELLPVAHGIAWAGHREILQEIGLYDACVIGGGDKAMALASAGHAQMLTSKRPMTDMHEKHYLTWAELFGACTTDRVGFVPGTVFHLWHGHFKRRGYEQRHKLLKQLEFNPYHDLVMAENGTWRWAQHSTSLKSSVRDYFFGRLEDGV